MRKYNDKKFILVDVFDTIIFRSVHPYKVLELWASKIIELFDMHIDTKAFFTMRRTVYSRLSLKTEPNYELIIRNLYEKCLLRNLFSTPPDFNNFLSVCHEVELVLEKRAQYPNDSMLKRLEKLKKRGSVLIAVSDFYLSKDDLSQFISDAGFGDIFSDVFSSCDYNASKHNGDLYPLVLKQLVCSSKDCVMFGDDKKRDIINAKKHGIVSIYFPNYKYRILNQINKKAQNPYIRSKLLKKSIKKTKNKNTPFLEYTVLFYVFTQRLFHELKSDNINQVAFLSREGLFLKKLFDYYQQQNIPEQKRIETKYIKVSRRSIININEDLFRNPLTTHMSLEGFLKSVGLFSPKNLSELQSITAESNEIIHDFKESEAYQKILSSTFKDKYDRMHKKAVRAFKQYTKEIFGTSDERIAIVDVGWRGSMQIGLSSFTNKPCIGYYIGIIDSPYQDIDGRQQHKGLMFSNNNDKSPYFDYFRSNTQLYEQLLSAPHGGAVSYNINKNKEVVVALDWLENEKALYENLIKDFQAKSYPAFTRLVDSDLTIPSNEVEDKILSRMVVKSSLFGSKKSFEFLCQLDSGFAWNFSNEAKGLKYEKIPKMPLKDVLSNPHQYFRYFVKLERYLNNYHLRIFYKPLARMYYFYICVLRLFKPLV